MIGARIGRYEVVERIGAGGMGEVYRARDTSLHRFVALKLLTPEAASSSDRVRRFEREARAASSLSSPHIVHIYEVGKELVDENIVHFIAMELVEGSTLREHFARGTPRDTILAWLAEVAETLAGAHAAGIVHRDLKPENLMISHDGHPKILDFGLAKLVVHGQAQLDHASPTALVTRSGSIMGTPSYMSPEQLEGRNVDHRSDIFSFGTILYEALASRKPFEGTSAVDVMHAILHNDPLPLPDAQLEQITSRCLRKDPTARYPSADKISGELRAYLHDEKTMSLSKPSPTRPFSRRVGVTLAVVALLAISLLIYTRYRDEVVPSQPHQYEAPATTETASKQSADLWSNKSPDERDANLRLLKNPQYENGERVYGGDPLDLSLKMANIVDVIPLFSQLTGVNIILDPRAVGTVTVHAEGMPWDQTFLQILQTNELTYRVDGDIVVVFSESENDIPPTN